MLGAIGYIRVSTAEQALGNNSLDVQERKIREYCRIHDVELLQTFVDPGASARTTERPEFQKMLAYCRRQRRKIAMVIVADLSRFSRNVFNLSAVAAMLKNLGITIESVDEPITDDSAVGQLMRNMITSYNQYFSDSLSERTRSRMRAVVNAGRFPWPAPIGYLNVDKQLCIDPERGHFIRQAFELIASGRFSTGDSVLKLLTAMGFKTRRGRSLSKGTFARILSNRTYAGWIETQGSVFHGTHEPLISDELFQAVQNRLNGKSRPHKKVNEDFPLRGVVRCADCGTHITAGWAVGRARRRYPRYWCWHSGCMAVKLSREELEGHFKDLLHRMQPTAKALAELPERLAAHWHDRKARIAANAASLTTRLADQKTLNQRAIIAKLEGKLSDDDFDAVKTATTGEIARIETDIKALDSERFTMEELLKETQAQAIDLVGAWDRGNVHQRHELAAAFFPEGLVFSQKKLFFEPSNTVITEMLWRFVADLGNVGVPDGI